MLPAQVVCLSWYSLPQGGAGPWWVAQMEARLEDRQERSAGVVQVGFPFLVTCNVPDSESAELPVSVRHRLLLPTLWGFSPAHLF